jgi:hypothetical protein
VRFPAGKIHEDEFVTWKILFKAGNVAFVNQPLYSYYRNENGIVKGGWSPSYVFGIDAIWEQINFFESNGYAELIDQRMRLMLFTLYRWIRLVLNAGDDESLKNLKMLSQKMKKSLRLYRKYLSAFNIYERFSFYCLASGNPMVIKWVIKNDFEPLQKIFAKLKS